MFLDIEFVFGSNHFPRVPLNMRRKRDEGFDVVGRFIVDVDITVVMTKIGTENVRILFLKFACNSIHTYPTNLVEPYVDTSLYTEYTVPATYDYSCI